MTDETMPPLDHPEPHTMMWTALEIDAIHEYARAYAATVAAKQAEPHPPMRDCPCAECRPSFEPTPSQRKPAMTEQLRQRFEEWANSEGYQTTRVPSGAYFLLFLNSAWRGYQAASAQCTPAPRGNPPGLYLESGEFVPASEVL